MGAYYEKQDPSGSSSGSAVAASIGLAVACLGGDTAGSIIAPAATANIVGIRPTPGLVSRYLCVPLAPTLDTIGPMAPDVKTCAALLQAIAGRDQKDSMTQEMSFDTLPNYINACQKDALKGARIGMCLATHLCFG